jgi:hypothetical protein
MADTTETLSLMMDAFAPKDNNQDNNDYHKSVRTLTEQPVNTEDNQEFTTEEVRNAIESMANNKAPGKDGITGNIYKQAFKMVPHL